MSEIQGLDREIDKIFHEINFLEDLIKEKMDRLEFLKKKRRASE